MNNNQNQINFILNELSKQIGANPNQLQKDLKSGNINGILNNLPQNEAKKINDILSSPKALNDLLNTKEAKNLMEKLNGGR